MPVFTALKFIFGVALFTAFAIAGAYPGLTAEIPSCALPNVRAYVVRAASADAPPIAAQQGIAGTVNVVVWLDAQSAVVRTAVQSSPSELLNASAIAAARNSLYRTAVANCVPVASVVVFRARFANPY